MKRFWYLMMEIEYKSRWGQDAFILVYACRAWLCVCAALRNIRCMALTAIILLSYG